MTEAPPASSASWQRGAMATAKLKAAHLQHSRVCDTSAAGGPCTAQNGRSPRAANRTWFYSCYRAPKLKIKPKEAGADQAIKPLIVLIVSLCKLAFRFLLANEAERDQV